MMAPASGVLAHSQLTGHAPGGPIANQGAVFVDDVRVSPKNAVLNGVFQGSNFQAATLPPLKLPDAPAPPDDPKPTRTPLVRWRPWASRSP